MSANVILLSAAPRDPADGSAQLVRLAGGGGVVPYLYGGQLHRAGIVSLPRIVTALSYPGDDLGTGALPQALTVAWKPGRRVDFNALATLFWADAPVAVYLGPEGQDVPVELLTGKVLTATADEASLSIALADPAVDLKRPLLVDRFAGTGGVEGPAEWADKIKRRAWGRNFNVLGEVIDKANNVLCFGDPAHPWQAFDAVRHQGATVTPVNVLGWQGSIAATFAALQAAAVPNGGCVAAPSIACAKFWTRPETLTADIRGENADGYVETAPEIAARMVAARSAIPFVAGTVAAAVAARPAPFGWLADDDSGTIAAALDEMLGDVSLLWVLDGGAIVLRSWAWNAAQAEAISHRVTRRKVHKPVGKRRLGFRRNRHEMTRGDIAGVVLAGDVTFPDGAQLSDLRPAQAGATAGATVGIDVQLSGGSVPAQNQLVTSEGISAGIEGQGWGATAAQSRVDNYQVRIGQNRAVNSRFALGTKAWASQAPQGVSNAVSVDSGVNLNADWSGALDVWWARINTSGGAAWAGTDGYADLLVQRGPWSGENSLAMLNCMPVKQGDRVHYSALLARHRCGAEIFCLIFNKSFSLVESFSFSGGRISGGAQGIPANFDRVGDNRDVTHADAALACIMVRARPDPAIAAAPDAYIFATEIMLAQVAPGQTAWPAYNDGPEDPRADQTIANTAAAIAGQGAFATVSSVGYGSPLLTGFSTLATLGSLAFGSPYLLESAGGASATLSAFKTALGVASAIVGQGSWATYAGSISSVVAPGGNIFPYPRPTRDGRTPAQLGWSTFFDGDGSPGGFGAISAYDGNQFGGPAYVISRTGNYPAKVVVPYFDIELRDASSWIAATRRAGVSLSGYAANGSFQPYAAWINAAKNADLGGVGLTYNAAIDRYEGLLPPAPAGAAYIRVHLNSVFAAFNGYQDIVWWGVKAEPDAVTPYADISENRSAFVEWATGQALNALRPGEFGANVTESRTAAALLGQSAWATFGGLSPAAVQGQVQNLNTSGYLLSLAFVAERKITQTTRADGVTTITETMVVTVLGVAAAITGQGSGATANSLADLDPASAAILSSLNGGVPQVAAINGIISKAIDYGASITLYAALYFQAGGSSSGTGRVRIEVSPSGAGSWSTVATSAGIPVGPTEPGLDEVGATFTNTSGYRQVFDFRAIAVRTSPTAGGAPDPAQSFLKA
ncbi:MAG: hypothetical protein U5M50_08575 [Sphingobium sp.]|nr:hypothetical protein [Sphingobium sp.]